MTPVRSSRSVASALRSNVARHFAPAFGWVVREFGPDGAAATNHRARVSIIVTRAFHDDAEWTHASIARPDSMPDYDDLARLHRAVFGSGWAYQVFAPPLHHVNIHEHALHLWGRTDGKAALPNFGVGGSI